MKRWDAGRGRWLRKSWFGSVQQPSLVATQLRRLLLLQGGSVLLMLLAAAVLPDLLGLSIARGPALAVVVLMAALGLFAHAARKWLLHLGRFAVFGLLVLQVLGWSAFVYATGGAANPLISMLLPPLAIAATVLPAGLTWVLTVLAVCAYAGLWQFHLPIHLLDHGDAAHWHLAGMWATFTLSALVMVSFILRITRTLRERDQALLAAAQARARDEHILALGNLAAGAAHSLGTPLGTMRLLLDELLEQPHHDAQSRESLQLLGEQVSHCRSTLALLTAEAGGRRAEGGGSHPFGEWLRTVVSDWCVRHPRVAPQVRCDPSLENVVIVADVSLAQAITTLLDNAANVSTDEVSLQAVIDADQLSIAVLDRGPGMSDAQRAHLGKFPANRSDSGMGMGVYLAHATIARLGGTLSFGVRQGGGTVATTLLPLERMRA